MESQYYLLDYKEAMLSLALDLSIMSPSVNTALKNNLEILADDFSIEDFETIAANMTDQQLLTVSAELNSFAEGTRRSTKHENRRIMFRGNQDISMVRKFTTCAIDFIQKKEMQSGLWLFHASVSGGVSVSLVHRPGASGGKMAQVAGKRSKAEGKILSLLLLRRERTPRTRTRSRPELNQT